MQNYNLTNNKLEFQELIRLSATIFFHLSAFCYPEKGVYCRSTLFPGQKIVPPEKGCPFPSGLILRFKF